MKPIAQQTPLEKRAKWRRAVYYSIFAIFLVSLLFLISWFGFSAARRNPPYRFRAQPLPDTELIFPVFSTINQLEQHPALSTPLVDVLRFFQPSLKQLDRALAEQGQLMYWEALPQEPARWVLFLPLRKPQKVFVLSLRYQLEDSGLVQFPPQGEDSSQTEGDVLPFCVINSKGVIISSTSLSFNYRVVPYKPEQGPEEPIAEFISETGYFPPLLRHLWGDYLPEEKIKWGEVSLFRFTWQNPDLLKEPKVLIYIEFQGELDRDPLLVEQSWFHPIVPEVLTLDHE
jgi:hypothetical protein